MEGGSVLHSYRRRRGSRAPGICFYQASGLLLLGKSEFFVKRAALLRKNVGGIESEPASIQEETLSAFHLSSALEGRLSS